MILRLTEREIARLKARVPAGPQAPAPRRRAKPASPPGLAADGAPLGRMARIAYAGAEIGISLDLPPQPKERARTFVDDRALLSAFAGAAGDPRRFIALVKGKMRSSTPEATRRFEEAGALMVRSAMSAAGMAPFAYPVLLRAEFRFEGDIAEWPTAHGDGDLDNVEKSLKDAMNRTAWADDRLVVAKVTLKSCAPRAGISLIAGPAPPEFSMHGS